MARRLRLASPLLLLLSACADAPRVPEQTVVVAAAPAKVAEPEAPPSDSAALATDAPKHAVAADPMPLLLRDLRDPEGRPEKRPQAQVVVELQQLESLYAAAHTPKLLRRLGDLYAVLALVAAGDSRDKVVRVAREQAIKNYRILLGAHPGFCVTPSAPGQGPGTGCEDETLYSLAYEQEQAGQVEEARKTYFQLIQGWPSSAYIPNAYLAFGEMFFSEATSDPSKWPLAEQCFKEVLKYPFPGNGVYGYALLRLAEVRDATGDRAGARAAYQRLAAAARSQRGLRSLELPASLIPAGMGL